jgi:hypothetical protein
LNTINLSTYKVYEVNGDLDKLTTEEIFEAAGKHCSTTLRHAIAETLCLDIEDLIYKGYINIVDVFQDKNNVTYISTVENGNQHGSLFYMILKVPNDYDLAENQQLDKRVIKKWKVCASTDSPYKQPLKNFKKSVV